MFPGQQCGPCAAAPQQSGFSSSYGSAFGGNASLGASSYPNFPTANYTSNYPGISFGGYSPSPNVPAPTFPSAFLGQSSFAPPTPYTAPFSSYVPPVSSYSPPTPLTYGAPASYGHPYASSTFGSSFSAPAAPSYSPPLATPYISPYNAPTVQPTPNFASVYGSYASAAAPSFAARSYGSYAPYSPYGGSSGATGFSSFSAWGGYRGLEQPLEAPILALPAPPMSMPTSVPLPTPYFPSLAAPAPSFLPTYDAAAVYASAGKEVEHGSGAPADAPQFAEDQAQEEYEEDVIEGEPITIGVRYPWSPPEGEEEFDLEYSRQVAARRVIGEEDE